MQVRLTAHERHRHFIAATVVIVRSMERLVYIANEMDEVREAVVLGHAGRPRRRQDHTRAGENVRSAGRTPYGPAE